LPSNSVGQPENGTLPAFEETWEPAKMNGAAAAIAHAIT